MLAADIPASLNTFMMVLSFVLGAMIGSFANVCICRWPAGESVVKPRSRCPKCMSSIAWYDNIPILSWLILGAKCRNCGNPISWQYPLVEAITGGLFLLVYLKYGITIASPIYMLLAVSLVICTFQDLADWTIPNEITFPGIPAGLAISVIGMLYGTESGLVVTGDNAVFNALGGILLGGGILYALDKVAIILLKKPGMGFGDVKLLAMMGGFVGVPGVIFTIVASSMTGAVIGLLVIGYFKVFGSAKQKEESGEEAPQKAAEDYDDDDIELEGHYLPFGPFLALGGLLYLFFGPELVDLYLSAMQPAL
jgi:leader peptidase (prepilin peptidase)/N-methyltransferase